MARAICEKCGESVWWSAGKGARLSAIHHAGCGGSLRSLTAGRRGAPKPTRYCAACGRELKGRAATRAGWLIGSELFNEYRVFVCTNPAECGEPELRQQILDARSSTERHVLLTARQDSGVTP